MRDWRELRTSIEGKAPLLSSERDSLLLDLPSTSMETYTCRGMYRPGTMYCVLAFSYYRPCTDNKSRLRAAIGNMTTRYEMGIAIGRLAQSKSLQ
jgi:hypothetical protein